MIYIYLSFATQDEFLGGKVVKTECEDRDAAVQVAVKEALETAVMVFGDVKDGVNGEVIGVVVPEGMEPDDKFVGRLLSREDLDEMEQEIANR